MLYPSELRAREHTIVRGGGCFRYIRGPLAARVRQVVRLCYSRRMTRPPFVWEVQVRRELLDDEVARLREVPYLVWRDAIGLRRTKAVVGRDQKTYTVTVIADWEHQGSEEIRVTLTLDGQGIRGGSLEPELPGLIDASVWIMSR